jgi:hypothetical protein
MRITSTCTIFFCIVASAIAYSPTHNVAGNYHRAAAKGEETSSFSTKSLRMGGPDDTPIQKKEMYYFSESYMRKLNSNALDAKEREKENSKREQDIANAQKLDKRFLSNLGQGPGDAAKGVVDDTVAAGNGAVAVTVAASKGLVGVIFATGKIIIRILIPWLGIKDIDE